MVVHWVLGLVSKGGAWGGMSGGLPWSIFFFLVMYQVAPLELRGEVRKSVVEGGDGRERGGSVVAFSMVFSLMVLCMVAV